jgi:hypothetical protein
VQEVRQKWTKRLLGRLFRNQKYRRGSENRLSESLGIGGREDHIGYRLRAGSRLLRTRDTQRAKNGNNDGKHWDRIMPGHGVFPFRGQGTAIRNVSDRPPAKVALFFFAFFAPLREFIAREGAKNAKRQSFSSFSISPVIRRRSIWPNL